MDLDSEMRRLEPPAMASQQLEQQLGHTSLKAITQSSQPQRASSNELFLLKKLRHQLKCQRKVVNILHSNATSGEKTIQLPSKSIKSAKEVTV